MQDEKAADTNICNNDNRIPPYECYRKPIRYFLISMVIPWIIPFGFYICLLHDFIVFDFLIPIFQLSGLLLPFASLCCFLHAVGMLNDKKGRNYVFATMMFAMWLFSNAIPLCILTLFLPYLAKAH